MKSAKFAASAAVLTMVSAGVTTGCDLQQAVDCARLALEVASSVEHLEQAAGSDDPTAIVDAADAVVDDLSELRDSVDDEDVRDAANSVEEAVESIRGGVVDGTEVDLTPLGDAAASLTDVCSP
ncbi:hypothetical protein [Streptomyces litchfieldiae]|uniref:Secreted protein n=1 Tax=Streptomyces litchfieldiae TaxID=3075543 RepID=A0ABU2MNQ1_9ACTN|nr:hypothetical protein [Streptomyces sp. DSM 44938]MDT0342973.1 hypothetical protein [Streptomyces sp. DSM 44938]